MDHVRLGVRDQPGQQGETLSPLKIQNLSEHSARYLQSQLLGRLRRKNRLKQEAKVAVSRDCVCVCVCVCVYVCVVSGLFKVAVRGPTMEQKPNSWELWG